VEESQLRSELEKLRSELTKVEKEKHQLEKKERFMESELWMTKRAVTFWQKISNHDVNDSKKNDVLIGSLKRLFSHVPKKLSKPEEDQ
jgi:hypothetical protein